MNKEYKIGVIVKCLKCSNYRNFQEVMEYEQTLYAINNDRARHIHCKTCDTVSLVTWTDPTYETIVKIETTGMSLKEFIDDYNTHLGDYGMPEETQKIFRFDIKEFK
jgi:hypothetical protein